MITTIGEKMLACDFIGAVAKASKLTAAEVTTCLAAVRDVCAMELKVHKKSRVPGLATFKIVPVAERLSRNPRSGVQFLEGPSTRIQTKAVPIFAKRIRAENPVS